MDRGTWLVRAGLVLLAALLVVTLIPGHSGESPRRAVASVLNGQNVRITLPSGDGDPKGVAIWFHGQGGDARNRVEGPWLDALRRDGWAVASSDFHFTSWGNAASTDDTQRLIEWAEAETGSEVKLWVSGSMGGAVSLNAINFGIAPPPCWYGVKPAISLTQMGKVPGGRRFINAAFQGPVPVDRDPVRNLATLPTDTRYRVVASRDDHWVMYDENSGPLVDTLTARGAEVSVLQAHGLHDDPSHWNARDLVEFADACADPEGDIVTAASPIAPTLPRS